MANTDTAIFYLLDTDLTTRLAILPAASGHIYLELNEPGSGELRIPLDTTSAGLIASGQFVECWYRGSYRSGFFVENIKEAQADANEQGGRFMSISGRGALALLDEAIVWDDGTNATTRTFTDKTKGYILKTLIDEAQARGGLASLTYDADLATLDQDDVAWTDSESLSFSVGTSLLDVVRQFVKTGIDFDINLSGGSFVLAAYSTEIGTDKSETIFFRTGRNCEEVSSDERGDSIANALRVKYKDGFVTVTDGTSITARRRREILINMEAAQTASSATTYAAAKIDSTKDPKKSISVKIYDGISPRLFIDYVMGDYIMLDVMGTETKYRVLGIQADYKGDDYFNVVVELNSILYENEIKMSQDIDWLTNQWTTARDANQQEVTYWGTGSLDMDGPVEALAINGNYLYIGGDFTKAVASPLAMNNIACYNLTTGEWTALGAGLAGEVVHALCVHAGDLYIGCEGGGIYQWDGLALTEIGNVTAGADCRINALETDGTYLYAGGHDISKLDGVTINDNIGRWDGADWTTVGDGGKAGYEILCICYYSGAVYCGWKGGGAFDEAGMMSHASSGAGVWATKWISYTGATADPVYAIEHIGAKIYMAAKDKFAIYDTSTADFIGNIAIVSGGDAEIRTITTLLNDLYIGGDFDTVEIYDFADWFAEYPDPPTLPVIETVTGCNNIIKISGGSPSVLNGGTDDTVRALTFNGDDLYIGGDFHTADGKAALHLAGRFTDFQDILDFIDRSQNAVLWGQIGGTLADQLDLQAALDAQDDASEITYTPTTAADWDGSADPGDVDNALDQLAERVTDVEASGSGDISGTGVVGQVAEFVTDTKTIQAAKIIGPAANILTITNAAASTLAMNVTAGKTVTITATDNSGITFTGASVLTVPATGTVALLGTQNVFADIQQMTGLGIGAAASATRGINVSLLYDSASAVFGEYLYARNGSTGNITGLLVNARGRNTTKSIVIGANLSVDSEALTAVSVITDLEAVRAKITHTITDVYNSTVSNADTIISVSPAIAVAGGGTLLVGNATGVRIQNHGNAQTTNNYGLYIEAQSGATALNYALYTNAGLVHFGGVVDMPASPSIGGFTIGFPAAGTVALLGTANVFTNTNQFEYIGLGIAPDATREINVLLSNKLYGMYLAQTTTNADATVMALNFDLRGNNATKTALFGIQGIVYSQSTSATMTVTTQEAIRGRLAFTKNNTYNLTVTQSNTFHAVTSLITASSSGTLLVSTHSGMRIDNMGFAQCTNSVGLYIDDQSGSATGNYAIFTNAGDIIFNFGGAAQADFTAKTDNYDAIFMDTSNDSIVIMSNAAGKVGLWGHAAAVQPSAYTITNDSADRALDCNATTLDELADVVGTLIKDLQSWGAVG